jgi:NAD(P)-dependent dehydrogenase (short-subunit alcohol dehydrogenase family)
MKKVLIVGGTGGLGTQVVNLMSNQYDITSIGSQDLDLRNINQCEEFFNNKTYDVVINFAGINYDSLVHKISSKNIDMIKNLLDVNLIGTINLVSTVLKNMREQKYGRIILISSVLSEKNIIGTGIYSSCKSFIDKFVKNVSLENIKYGITSNTIQLGYFDGGMTYRIPEKNLEKIQQTIGLNRFGKIEELTNTIKFIIENEYVTGVNIKIDGGLQ